MSNAKHSSESVDHYTPIEIVDAARELMGGIDLDPASCERANKYIRAKRYFAQQDNGLSKAWKGRVFLNPPGGRIDEAGNRVEHGGFSSAKVWWQQLSRSWWSGKVETAVFVGFSLEILQTTQGEGDAPIPLQFPCCYPAKRMRFLVEQDGKLSAGGSPTHANVLVYLPKQWDNQEKSKFSRLFEDFGHCVWPAVPTKR